MFVRIGTFSLFSLVQIFLLVLASATLVADDDSGVRFFGVVQSLPQGGSVGNWQVSGSTVQVSASTEIDQENGAVAVGACVEVEGSPLAGNSISASRVRTEEADKCGSGAPLPNPNQPDFFGSIQSLPAAGLVGDWLVSGKTIRVAANTPIEQHNGPASVGACVEVQGATNSDGSITATKVEVQSAAGGCSTAPRNQQPEVEFFGVVQSLPQPGAPNSLIGNWLISGRIVQVSAATELEIMSQIVVGACVKIEGRVASDGSVIASKLELESESSSCQIGMPKPEEVKFFGTVQSLPPSGLAGNWTVGNRKVQITANTEIETERGAVSVGSCVEVEGPLQSDNSILASGLQTEEASRCTAIAGNQGTFESEGIIESIPAGGGAGDWKIAGQTVSVSATTNLDTEHGPLVVVACVEVLGTVQPDGVLAATKIESRSSSGVCVMHDGVVSAASFSSISVAPGEIVSLFGFNLGPASSLGPEVEPDDKVSNTRANVRVLFDGVAAPLLFVSAKQVNAVVPFSVAGKTTTQVQIENNGAWSDSVAVPVTAAAPSIFTLTQSGKGQGAILNYDAERRDYSVNGASNGAARRSIIVLFATGGGQMDPPGDDGRVTGTDGLARTVLPVRVTIGGKEAEVEYAGSAPQLVSGVLQVNVRVPNDAPQSGEVPVVLIVGDHSSRHDVTMAIR